MTEKTHHVSEKKKEIAKGIQELILNYPIIAAVNMENLPAPQLQQMRAELRGKIELTMTKRRVIRHAIEGVKEQKKDIEKLEPYLKGMPALIFTKENPFSLFKTLKKSKTSAPAKAGQTAPFDLIVQKGSTSFAPGPVIGELAQLGIKSGVEGGKVVIKEDSVVVKEGKKISAKAAEVLARLGIEPMEVGLNVTAVYENGNIFTKEILNIDEEKFKADLEKAAVWAFNLAVSSAYPTKETINILIGKAFNEAKILGLSQEIIDEGIIEELLSRAERSALLLKSTANIETVEKPKEEKEEKPKAEEKKPEIREELTPVEKKEEKILEEEKEIIQEEERLEKEAKKPKIEAPVEKEVEEEVEEEEEKHLEEERIEKEKELERIEEQKKAEEERKKQEEAKRKAEEEEQKRAKEEKRRLEEKRKAEESKRKAEEEAKKQEEAQDDTDKKIAEMVAKTKKFVKGEIPDAEKLVEEAGKLAAEEIKREGKKPEEAPKVKSKEIPALKIQEKKPKEKVPTIQELTEKKEKDAKKEEKKKKEVEEVESLTKELIRKGTLRR